MRPSGEVKLGDRTLLTPLSPPPTLLRSVPLTPPLRLLMALDGEMSMLAVDELGVDRDLLTTGVLDPVRV